MLSSASKYAIQIIIYLAKNKEQGKIGGKAIAEKLGLAAPFVGKVLQPLAHSGILKSTKGPNGGFVLEALPEEISLLDIIQIYEGNDAFKECLLNSCNCKNYIEQNGQPCRIHEDIAPARELLFDSLRNKTIAGFLELNEENTTDSLSEIFKE
ncbi:MAG: Rrf2 family transcriptional regulator [Flavobacteriaceae bacterium]|nr:Rrf2 family transcriptional regulator [Flavobacteriaceae bacterium]